MQIVRERQDKGLFSLHLLFVRTMSWYPGGLRGKEAGGS